MAWLVFLYALSLGVEQSDMLVGYDPNQTWYAYTNFQTSVLVLDTFEVGGSSTIRIRPSDPPFFTPVEAEFIFFAQLRYKLFSIGYEHACYHNFWDYYTRDAQEYNRIYFRISNDTR